MQLIHSNKLRSIITSLFVVFLVHFSDLNYLGNSNKMIQSDGAGYYEYLPSIFIHHDFNRKDSTINESNTKYNRLHNYICYVIINEGYFANKYPIGTAVLEFPFFIGALIYENNQSQNITGLEDSFQYTYYFSTLIYLFLGLFFLYKLLQLYRINWKIIFLTQLLIVFATSTLNYSTHEFSFSHIYSFFAFNAFLFYSKKFFLQFKLKHFILASILIGLIILIRQINVIIVLVLPFVAGSMQNLNRGFQSLIKKPFYLIYSVLIILCINAIQLIAWYYQTGDFIIYSYQNEGFNFLNPEIINILFSYRKGLFIYTPICLIATLTSLIFLVRKEYFLFASWAVFFIAITYIFSSWWSWYYGGGYGLRAYIEYYAIFFIPLAIFINSSNKTIKVTTILLSLLTIPIAVIQTYQYKYYIIHGYKMNKELFWDTFLETDNRFRGYSFKKHPNLNDYSQIKKFDLGNLIMNKNEEKNILSIDLEEEKYRSIKNSTLALLEFNTKIEKSDLSNFIISVKSSNQSHFEDRKNIAFFKESSFGEFQKGLYFFEFHSSLLKDDITLNLTIESAKNDNAFQNITFILYEANNEKELRKMILNIKQDKVWLDKIKTEAEKVGISLNENIKRHAAWVLNN